MNLAIFDLDNTLLDGDSDYNWGIYLVKKGYLDEEEYKVKNQKFFEEYQHGKLDIFAFAESVSYTHLTLPTTPYV